MCANSHLPKGVLNCLVTHFESDAKTKTTCLETSEKHLPIAVSEQGLAWKLFENRSWSHRHRVIGTELFCFPWAWRQEREVRFSGISLINLFCMCETHMRYLRNCAVRAGIFAADMGLRRHDRHRCLQGKAKKYSKIQFLCSVSSNQSFSNAQITDNPYSLLKQTNAYVVFAKVLLLTKTKEQIIFCTASTSREAAAVFNKPSCIIG